MLSINIVNSNQVLSDIMKRIELASIKGLYDTSKIMKQEMLLSTSGNISSKSLRHSGYPFAKRHKIGKLKTNFIPQPFLPINIQTGQLKASYFDFFSRLGQSEFSWTFGFNSPHQVVLSPGGTMYMRDRQYWVSLRTTMEPVFINRMQLAFKQVFP